ncbi:MAG TPA: hypothetical protein ENI95_07575, partial [Chloroflexi bacterium]|nr:hypothetical protein [Chloroflexota bacterium]
MRWWLFLPADIYFAGLGVYFGARLAVGYRFWPVELVSQFIHLLLLPAFPLLIVLLLSRHWLRAVAAGMGILAFGWLFGGLFLPSAATGSCNEGSAGCQTLTVMSYNAGSGLAEP